MLTSNRIQRDPVASGPVAIVGTDGWLRGAIAARLASSQLKMRDYGPGTSSLRPAGTLVLTPRLVPTALNPARDVGLSANAMTLAAAMSAGIDDVVLVSLVGADPRKPGHLGALGRFESRTRAWAPRLTIVRATQVYGSMRSPGPLVDRMRNMLRRDPDRFGKLRCRPVFIDDLLDIVEAAIYREVAEGTIGVAGQTVLTVGEFIFEFDQRNGGQTTPTSTPHRWPGLQLVRSADRALCELLEAQSAIVESNSSGLSTVPLGNRPALQDSMGDRPQVA